VNNYNAAWDAAVGKSPATAANEERPTAGTDSLSGNAKSDSAIVACAAKSGKPPAQLQALQGWLIWRFEQLPGEPKARKVPYYVRGGRRLGRQGAPSDQAQLVTYDGAVRASAGFDGVGLAVLPDFGITALDFDDCVRDGAVDRDVLAAVAGTYAELSPSGNGVRAFVAGSFGANRKSHANATQFGVEVFSTKGFVTFTGNALQGSVDAIGERTAAMTALYALRFGDGTASATSEPIGLALDQAKACLAALNPDITYNEWLQAGMAIHFETEGAIEGLDAWDNWSSGGGKYPGRESLEGRWDGFGRSDGAQVTGGTLIKMARAAGAEIGLVAASTDFAVIPEPPMPAGGYFPILTGAEFLRAEKAVSWLIKGVIPCAQLGVLFGESTSGKTFLAFDMACAMGRGIEWNGKRVRKSRVLYIVAEGVNGFRKRVRAYCHQFGLEADDLGVDYMSDVTPNLIDREQVKRLVQELPTRGKYDLVIMDTFAQMTAGANENSGEDVGKALAHCKAIGKAAGDAMVLLVHHSGKDSSKGARGWSGLRAAADVEIEVTRAADDRCAELTKLKDGQDGAQFGFRLLTVVLGQDVDGQDVTSCIVEHTGTQKAKRSRQRKLGDVEAIVMQVHAELDGLTGSRVAHTELLDAVKAQLITPEDGKRDTRGQRINRAVEALMAAELLVGRDGFLSSPGRDLL
jgi:hypothetical protein